MFQSRSVFAAKLFGKQEQAEELVDFYQKPVDYINQQLKQVTDRKKFTGSTAMITAPVSLELPMTAGTT